MSQVFEKAFEYLMQNEGYESDDRDDSGGYTKFGISSKWFSEDVEIQNLTKAQAKKIYYDNFFKTNLLNDVMKEDVAIKIFDACVNMGSGNAVTCLQRTSRALQCNKNLKIDGIIGSNTLIYIEESCEKSLMCSFASELAGHYRMLAARHSKFEKFIRGWLNRAYKMP